MLRTCVATDPTLKPRSAARARSTCATSSGWPDTSVVPTSTAPGIVRMRADQLVAQALQLLHVVAAHVQVDRRLVGRPLHELGIGDLDLRKRDRLEARPQIRFDVLELDAPLVLPRGLHPELRLAHLAAGAHRGEHLPDFRRVEQRAFHFRHALHGFVEGHARRQVDHHDKLTAILVGHELGADERKCRQTRHEHEERGRHDLPRVRQRPAQHLEILTIERVVGLAPALQQPAHPCANALFGRHVAHNRDDSIGRSVDAITSDIATANATVSANDLKNWPTRPVMNSTGRKTARMVNVVAMTARPISAVPLRAAVMGSSPSSMWR